MKLILDTNVIISATIRPTSKPSRLLDLALTRHFALCASSQLLAEYREVLLRPKFALDERDVDLLLDGLHAVARITVPPPQSKVRSTDPKDQMILDLAVAQRALLVTGNLRHFADYEAAVSPAEALALLADERQELAG